MGNCCKKGLLQKFDHNTEIYSSCSPELQKKLKQIDISLEGDIYVLCPNKDSASRLDSSSTIDL